MYLNEAVIAANEIQMKMLRRELICCGTYASIKCNLIGNGVYIRVMTIIWGGGLFKVNRTMFLSSEQMVLSQILL
jgi:hypothetical protein